MIVGRDAIPVGQGGVHRTMRLVGSDAEQDGGGRIPDQYLGRIGGRHAIGGRKLGKPGQLRGLTPDLFIQLPVDHRLGLQAGNLYRQLARPTVVPGRRVNDIGIHKEKEGEKHGLLHGTMSVSRRFRPLWLLSVRISGPGHLYSKCARRFAGLPTTQGDD